MAFGTFSTPALPPGLMTGTQAPQKLFGDIPAAQAQIPGMVTPETTVAMPNYVDWAGITEALTAQEKLKQASADRWARAAAMNNARAAQSRGNQGWNTGGSTSATEPVNLANQSSGMGAQYTYTAGKGPILWAPRSMNQQQLGTWSEQQQKKAMAENRRPPVILKAYADDPIMPGEQGGGMSQAEIGKSIFGPGLSTALGGANPAVLARMWGGGGGTRQGQPTDPFPQQSLRERTSPGPKFQYDYFGGR